MDTRGAAGFIIDEEMFEVRFGPSRCFLGPGMEFRLIGALFDRKGRFVSLGYLIDRVWGGDDETGKNTIHRTVCNLRRKLREAGITQVVIEAKVGYYRLLLP